MLDSNFVWANQWCCYFDSLNCGVGYNSVGGDTLYNGKIYKKIYGTQNATGYTSYFLREDSGFVYNKYEKIYYNFHLQVGDTFTFPLSSITPNVEVIVDTVETKFIFGQTRKVIKFDFLNMEWIEGVGSTTGLMYDEVWYWDCNQYLNCFYDGIDSYMGEGFDSCFIYNGTIGVNSFSVNEEIIIYPNPTNGVINLDITSIRKSLEINIYNSLGLTVKQIEKIDTPKDIKINIEDLDSGIYFLQIILNNRTISTKKIIVQ